MFCGIVSRALTLEVLSTGVAGNYNGALQVVLISFLALSSFCSHSSPELSSELDKMRNIYVFHLTKFFHSDVS